MRVAMSLRSKMPRRFGGLAALMVLGAFVAVGCGGAGAAANISGVTFGGDDYDLKAGAGRPLVLNFWFPSCPPCVVELPDFQEAYERYGDRVDFLAVFLPSPVDTEERARAFIDRLGVEFPVITDIGATAQIDYAVTSFPTTFFIRADRENIALRRGGQVPAEELEARILNLLNE